MKEENLERQNGDIEKTGEGDAIDDPNLVWWDGPDDPNNPLNWSSWSKTIQILLIATVCFVTPLASSMFAPGVPGLMREFHNTSSELSAFVVSIYVLGFAYGPIFLAPLSEIYGRQPIYHVGNSLFVAFSIACALSRNLNVLIMMRFMEGIFGSAPLTNGMSSTVCWIYL
jgi:MFS family permease